MQPAVKCAYIRVCTIKFLIVYRPFDAVKVVIAVFAEVVSCNYAFYKAEEEEVLNAA